MSTYKAINNGPYLSHIAVQVSKIKGGTGGNIYHDPKTGQFTFSPDSAKRAGMASKVVSEGLGKASKNISNSPAFNKKNPRLDLSKMSDDELRQVLNRERMEQEYNRYFNTPQESKGKKFVETALPIASTVVGIVGTGLIAYSTWKGSK